MLIHVNDEKHQGLADVKANPQGGINHDKYLFNPFELFFCGYSNSGKTTLIEKLTKKLAVHYRIGYIKHDAHRFKIDYEGKDTCKIYSAGASEVFINDREHFAQITNDRVDIITPKKMMNSSDIVFIEGYKFNSFPKILVIDQEQNIYRDYLEGKVTNVIAFAGISNPQPQSKIPYFERNDISGITAFIIKYFERQIKKIPLYGLMLADGESKNRVEYCFTLLSEFCEKAFVTGGKEQDNSRSNIPVINDTFLDMGQMGGIISALRAYDAAFLVLSGNIPYVSQATIKNLVKQRNPFKFATSYFNFNPEINQPEPVFGIYEPKIKGRLLDFVSIDSFCPVRVLLNSEVKLIKHRQWHPSHIS